MEGIHAHDLGTFLDEEGIAVRTGHHCAEPVHKKFGIPASVRASLGIYSSEADVIALRDALLKAQRFFLERELYQELISTIPNAQGILVRLKAQLTMVMG